MNFDRLNPLSSYLASYGGYGTPSEPNPKHQEPSKALAASNISSQLSHFTQMATSQLSHIPLLSSHNQQNALSIPPPPEISDWGIEESVSSPSMSNHNFFQNQLQPLHSISLNFDDDIKPYNPHVPHPRTFNQLHQLYQAYENYETNSQNYDNNNHSNNNNNYGSIYNTAYYQQPGEPDFSDYYHQYIPSPLHPTTENLSKYIHKYLSLHGIERTFWEKFKYGLVVSNLLDDTMILSKSEQALSNLKDTIEAEKIERKSFPLVNTLNCDGTQLRVLEKSYSLHYSRNYGNLNNVIIIINLIIFLMKQEQRRHLNYSATMSYSNRMKMFKILLIISTKLIKFNRFKLLVMSQLNLSYLNSFLLLNYSINKKLIQKLIILKELDVYYYVNRNKDEANHDSKSREVYKSSLREHLANTLHFLNLNLRTSIARLLPNLNGDLFEQYCNLNNIDILLLQEDYRDGDEEELNGMDSPVSSSKEKNSLDEIVFNMNKFNQLRKLFICQLLTINESSVKKNFFIYKLMDQFPPIKTEDWERDDDITAFNNIAKLGFIRQVLHDHNKITNSFVLLFNHFDDIHNNDSAAVEVNTRFNISHENQDILAVRANRNSKEKQAVENSNEMENTDKYLESLIGKVIKLGTNLKYFQSYNRSTKSITNVDEFNEKLMIFNQFEDDIQSIKEMYHLNAKELSDIDGWTGRHASPADSNGTSTSPRIPSRANKGEFNLKTFHTSSIKKRYSLPSSVTPLKIPLGSPVTPRTSVVDSDRVLSPEGTSGKKYKRLSTGLQLGLLTVFEDPKQLNNEVRRNSAESRRSSTVSASRRSSGQTKTQVKGNGNVGVSYDDNYVNILPPTSYETYNQDALDQLSNSKKYNITRNSNRFSLNSVNSNISGLTDLISSTHITSYDEEDVQDGLINDSIRDKSSLQISKEELKLKLEESFNRIYNLESENKLLKLNKNTTNSDHDTVKFDNASMNEHLETSVENRASQDSSNEFEDSGLAKPFLTELEQSLSSHHGIQAAISESEIT